MSSESAQAHIDNLTTSVDYWNAVAPTEAIAYLYPKESEPLNEYGFFAETIETSPKDRVPTFDGVRCYGGRYSVNKQLWNIIRRPTADGEAEKVIDLDRLNTDLDYWREVAPKNAVVYLRRKLGNGSMFLSNISYHSNTGLEGEDCDGEKIDIRLKGWELIYRPIDPEAKPSKPDIGSLMTSSKHWDEVAPEGARYFFQSTEESGTYFFAKTATPYVDSGVESTIGTNCDGYHYMVTSEDWQIIPRPGFEPEPEDWTGKLPPVGAECEVRKPGQVDWHSGACIARGRNRGLDVAVIQIDDRIWIVSESGTENVRPPQSDKDREIAELAKEILAIAPVTAPHIASDIAKSIIDQGWRKGDEQ